MIENGRQPYRRRNLLVAGDKCHYFASAYLLHESVLMDSNEGCRQYGIGKRGRDDNECNSNKPWLSSELLHTIMVHKHSSALNSCCQGFRRIIRVLSRYFTFSTFS